ncbi:SDR family oxidoreductase [Motiliproteus sp. SC1-56]|uniref:SDR family NAD(P)-dependent oxidoreductase n=1 Tax=Motiliproteus sp. SC1-56 TaxID=2799565 RepID=UPI001A8F4F85|nr:SDR family NAD(P)-dependent oxidoreductase [Motiliproteus sp. SC1-56]
MKHEGSDTPRPVAWITGASQGIGAALSLELARRGWRVAASARSEEKLAALARHSEAPPGAIRPYPLDVLDPAACLHTIEQIERDWGPVGRAVLNAGTHRPMTAADFDREAFYELLELNVMGTVNSLQPLLQSMRRRQHGQIAVVASLAGYRGLPTASAYGASKAALINLCECLRPELARDGVKLQVINPGFVKTPLTDRNTFPMPFLIEAPQAARHIARGLDQSRFEIRFPRRFALIMGLLRHLPYPAYFAITRRMLED